MLEIFLSSWGITSIIVAAILFVAYFYFCAKEISAINDEIKKAVEYLDTSREFENIDAEFKNYSRLLPVWKIFAKSLTTTNDVAYSTTAAAEFFSTQNLTRGMNMSFWQAYGGIFTGLGILGTFLGLTYGLSGLDMSNNIETLQNSIKKLLSGVESAFVTSLVGIAGALIYSGVHHQLIKNFQSNVDSLVNKLDEIFPRRSAEDWLKETYIESRQQTTALKNIGENVARALEEAFDEQLANHVETICTAINKLGDGGAAVVGEIFSTRVGEQMEKFSAALDRFSDSIDEKLQTANEISKLMNEQMLTTLKELNEAFKQDRANREATDVENTNRNLHIAENFEKLVAKLLADLKNFTEQQQEFLSNSTNTNAAQISGAVKAFNEIVTRHNETTQKTFVQVQNLLNETKIYLQRMNEASTSLKQAAEPVRQSTLQLSQNLEETSAQMKNLSAANQITRQNLSDLTARLSTFIDNFNGIADELERSTKIIHDSLNDYNVTMSTGLRDALTDFDSKVANAAGHLQSTMENLNDALEDFNKKRR